MTVVSFGTGDQFGGYGHSAQFSGVQGMLFAVLLMHVHKILLSKIIHVHPSSALIAFISNGCFSNESIIVTTSLQI